MTTMTDVPKPIGFGVVRPALLVTVCGSAMAGLVHAAAARGHDGGRLLVWMFALCSIAQVVWAVAAARRPSGAVLAAGLVINAGAVAVWALTRTVGTPVIDSLAQVEAVGTQDLAAALFAASSAMAAGRMLAVPVARTTLRPAWAGALAALALLAATPALRAEHTHREHNTHLATAGHAAVDDHAGHDERTSGSEDHASHERSGTATSGELASHDHATNEAGHLADHSTGTDGETHPHTPTDPGEPTATGHPHSTTAPTDPDEPSPEGPIISLDDPRVTSAQRAIAVSLIDGVRTALAGETVASIEAVGYQWIGDGAGGGYQHYVNWTYYTDGIELDPSRIESIVVQNGQIVSGMYILNPGKTMADVPTLAGELTTWHDHQNLCFSGTQLVGIAVDGTCARGVLTPTPPMLHVWLVENPCGPFAGIESHGDSDCGTHEH